MNELALFAGAGGGILGGQLLGWRTVCAVERDAYAAAVLAQRQNDGLLDLFPVWSDITTFDGHPWRGIVDVVSGGFPCQDISVAGKGAGIDGERSGLWGEMRRIVREVRPRLVYVENSPALTLRGLHRVLGDLAAMGYDAEWGVLAAFDVGAPHQRERIWIVGYSRSDGWVTGRNDYREDDRAVPSSDGQYSGHVADTEELIERGLSVGEKKAQSGPGVCGENVPHTEGLYDGRSDTGKSKRQVQQSGVCDCKTNIPARDSQRFQEQHDSAFSDQPRQPSMRTSPGGRGSGWAVEPDVGRVANGLAFRVDRLKAIGNGQVPACHSEAWMRLMERIKND